MTQEATEPVEQVQPSVLDAALMYAKRGWKVFPVRGKLPLVPHWDKDGTTDETQIRKWFEEPDWEFESPEQPHYEQVGIGLITGNGLVVLDIDTKAGNLEDILSTLAGMTEAKEFSAPVVRTGGGGLHFYFATDKSLRNRTGVVRGVDVRGDGGYVVAPPSLHTSGNRYEWMDLPIPDILPVWPFDFHKNEPAAVLSEGTGISPGTRNAVLASLAGSMRRRGMAELAIRAALLQENQDRCDPPLPEKEVIAIAKSIARYTPDDPVDVETGTFAMTSTDFLNVETTAGDWLIEKLWQESAIGFIVGPPKSFKSFFALELAFALATGKAFLGEFKVPAPRTVLLIQEESSKAAFKERVRRAGGIYGQADNLFLISNRPYNLEDPRGFERLKMEIDAIRPALTVLDPLASFIRGNENSPENMSAFVRSLRDLRNEYGTGFCIVHHSKKADPDVFRGSSHFYASSEVTVRIKRLDEDVARSKVTFELKDGESPERMDVQYRQTTGSLVPIRASQMLAQALAGTEDPYYNKT